MICPNCHAEYRDGFTTCADCEVALVEDLASAEARAALAAAGGFAGGPEAGLPGELQPLAELGSPEMLGTLLEHLEEAQIPYLVQAGTALALGDGKELENEGFPDPWRARVSVVGSFKPEARAMVDALVAEEKQKALAARAAAILGATP